MAVGDRFVTIDATLPIEVLRPGEEPLPLFSSDVYLSSSRTPEFLRLVDDGSAVSLLAVEVGRGTLELSYLAPISTSGERLSASVPLLRASAGHVELTARRPDIQFQGGSLWEVAEAEGTHHYRIGVAGSDLLELGWSGSSLPSPLPDPARPSPPGPATATPEIYGIGIAESVQLTVVNSDSSCTHLAVFRLGDYHPPILELELPRGARVLSVQVGGFELEAPEVDDRLCRIPVDVERPPGTPRTVSLRLDLPRVALGFVGLLELEATRACTTVGRLHWGIALPPGFSTRVLSSGLEVLAPPLDLETFGDYGRALEPRPLIHLGKNLAPPQPVELGLKYFQRLPGVNDDLIGSLAGGSR
jgi:hypothetical protein